MPFLLVVDERRFDNFLGVYDETSIVLHNILVGCLGCV